MQIRIGTSGFSYREWKGIFYPADLSAKKYLSFYSQHFSTTEINNTFYRIPNAQTVQTWSSEVPDTFSFTLKLNQRITHIKRLKDVASEMDRFLSAAATLKSKLGTILVQLPPNFRKEKDRLENFLALYAKEARLAFEFRHPSWYSDDVYSLLQRHAAAWAVVEAEEQEAIRQITAPFVYMRLRKGDYTREELEHWASWIRRQTVDVYCYLKHDESAPVLAKQLMESLDLKSTEENK